MGIDAFSFKSDTAGRTKNERHMSSPFPANCEILKLESYKKYLVANPTPRPVYWKASIRARNMLLIWNYLWK